MLGKQGHGACVMDDHVGKNLKRLVESLGETATQVHQLKDGEDPRKLLQTSLNGIMEQMKVIEERYSGEGTRVPLDLLQSLDAGKHPDLWFRQLLDQLRDRQRAEHSKASELKAFRSNLAQGLDVELPAAPTATIPDDPDAEIIID